MILCKNSDFLVSLEKLYMNCLYALSGVYAFNGNTTAFIGERLRRSGPPIHFQAQEKECGLLF